MSAQSQDGQLDGHPTSLSSEAEISATHIFVEENRSSESDLEGNRQKLLYKQRGLKYSLSFGKQDTQISSPDSFGYYMEER